MPCFMLINPLKSLSSETLHFLVTINSKIGEIDPLPSDV